jgi:hypothetical protein
MIIIIITIIIIIITAKMKAVLEKKTFKIENLILDLNFYRINKYKTKIFDNFANTLLNIILSRLITNKIINDVSQYSTDLSPEQIKKRNSRLEKNILKRVE